MRGDFLFRLIGQSRIRVLMEGRACPSSAQLNGAIGLLGDSGTFSFNRGIRY
jgi:hypothetical protein